MYEGVKKQAKAVLSHIWTGELKGRIDMEDNWITESSRFIQWEIKNPRRQDAWAFSMTLALAVAGALESEAQVLAQKFARALEMSADPGWHFVAENGYINAYFEPSCLEDYLKRGVGLDYDALGKAPSGAYATYRLRVINKAMEVKGVKPLDRRAHLEEGVINRFGDLFTKPSDDEGWEIWAKNVSKMTAEGRLRHMSPHEASALKAFIEASLIHI